MARAAAPGAAATMTTTAPAQPPRWALVACEELRAVAFADILAASLADLPGLQWVERERLAEAADELVGSALRGVDAAGSRLTALTPRDPDQARPFGATHTLRYAVSAHYGPILWQVRDQSFHAVRVEGEE